jgi:hypothetical protein
VLKKYSGGTLTMGDGLTDCWIRKLIAEHKQQSSNPVPNIDGSDKIDDSYIDKFFGRMFLPDFVEEELRRILQQKRRNTDGFADKKNTCRRKKSGI